MRTALVLTALLAIGVDARVYADDWTGDGFLVPLHMLGVRARSSQAITEIMRKTGDPIKKGDVLIRFDDRQAKADVRIAQSNLKRKEIELKQEEAKLINVKVVADRLQGDYERMESRWKNAMATREELSKADFEAKRGKSEIELCVSQIELAKEAIEAAKAQLDIESLKLEFLTITAPFDGYVSGVNCTVGEVVQKLDQPLMELIGGPSLVELAVPERLLSVMKAKPAIEIIIPDLDKPVKGEIFLMSPLNDPQTRQIKMQLAIPADAEKHARVGMIVKVKVPLKEKD